MEKYIKKVDINDFYITKNVCKIFKDKEKYNQDYDFIIKNIFILNIKNTYDINGIKILINNNYISDVIELLKSHPIILTYHIIESLIYKPEYYNTILDIMKNNDNKNIIKQICSYKSHNFVNAIIFILNENSRLYAYNKTIQNDFLLLFNIIKEIYNLDDENNTLLITKLCKDVKSEQFLIFILQFINIQNFDICYNYELDISSLDYLFLNNYIDTINFILDRLNYVYFYTIDDLNLFELFKINTNILFKILEKSNINNLINFNNQNIFYFIVENFDIEFDVLYKYLEMFNIDIYEKDVFGVSLYKLINDKYDKIKLDELYSTSITKYIENNITEKQIKYIDKLLIETNFGLYDPKMSTCLFNRLYLFDKHKKTAYIPYNNYNKNELANIKKLINIAKYNNTPIRIIKNIINYLPNIIESHIVWKNENENWMSLNLINQINSTNKRYVLIHSTLYTFMSNHANCILIDKHTKSVELFEPYGRLNVDNILIYNKWIKNNIADKLNYNFEQVQLYTGFQYKSDEHNIDNKLIGDPGGYCLAWCMLYLDIRMKNEFIDSTKKYTNAELTSSLINIFIMNYFNGEYIKFIRYYSIHLNNERDKLCEKNNIDSKLLYRKEYSIKLDNKISECMNKTIKEIIKKQVYNKI